MSRSFDLTASVSASTKRASLSSGKRGTPTTNLSGLSATPLDPVSAELQERLGLESPMELLQTFVSGALDIVEGDILVVGSTEYPIRAVEDYAAGPSAPAFLRLVIEELKR